MSWKISKIEIKNFKFFKEPFVLDTKNKNVLLYGENGAGKSSVYWSAYTHFQAYTKSEEDAKKYFTAGHTQSLRNRFSTPEDPAYIKISFNNGIGTDKTIEDSDTNYYSGDEESKKFMRRTAMTSDFMNYKFLSSLFDFKNSQENEIFPLLEKEALPYFDFDEPLYDIEGNPKGTNNAGEWWEYIKKTWCEDGAIPRNERNRNHFNQRTAQYKAYQALIEKFNNLLYNKFSILIARANAIITSTFHIDVNLDFTFEGAKFNEHTGSRVYDGKLHRPIISLKAKMVSPLLRDDSPINHPKSFFNEAKITCMALALRLAILEDHTPVDQAASVLFVDDLLISLDMPVRRMVIEELLKYADTYQMFILTHDRAFFHLVASEISMLGKDNEWIKYNLFVNKEDGLEIPVLVPHNSHLGRARLLLSQNEIPSSVNAARQAAEKILKDLLPENLKFDTSSLGVKMLNGLVQAFNSFSKEIGLPNNIAPHLNDARHLLLNPFSHDDIYTPFYRQELELVLSELQELNYIARTKIVNYPEVRKVEYYFQMHNALGGDDYKGTIVFMDTFNRYEYKGNAYYSWPNVELRTTSDLAININEWKSQKLYKAVWTKMGYNNHNRPQFIDCIANKETGNLLI